MDKLVRNILGITLVALAAAGCSKEKDFAPVSPDAGLKSLVVETASSFDVTKVAVEKDGTMYRMNWEGDESAVLVQRSDAASAVTLYSSSALDVTAGKAAFTFSGIAPVAGTSVYNYDILYPAAAVGAVSGKNVTLTIPASQTPDKESVDPAAALLAGRNINDFASQPASVNAPFGHLAAYGKMTMKFGSYASTTTVSTITITAEDCNIAGDLVYNTETGKADYSAGSVSTLVINGDNLKPTYNGYDIWFACKPFTLPAGKTLTIVTETSDKGTQTAVLKAGVDIAFNAGKVLEFPAWGITYTVTFDTHGGTEIGPAQVGRGQKISAPVAVPTRSGALDAGVYAGDISDPASMDYTFAGWYKDAACTEPFDFDSQIWGNTTIHAKWNSSAEAIDVSAEEIGTFNAGDPSKLIYRAISYVNKQSLSSETHYTVVMGGNGTIWGGQFPTLNNANAVIRIVGKGSERRITTGNNANIFTLKAGTLVLGKNILLNFNGTGNHNYPLVSVQDASTVILEDGCRIDDCSFGQYLVQLSSSRSTFIMNGGSISNNTASTDKTPCAPVGNNWGIFIMNGGTISGNAVTSTSDAANFAGAVFVNSWANNADHHFVKNGGVISGNTATRTASGTVTGRKGNQILYLGPKKKIDDDIAAGVNLTTMDDSCYSAPWATAPEE